MYLGMPGTRMTDEVSAFRKCGWIPKNAEACLDIVPDHLGLRKSILRALVENQKIT